MICPGCHRDIAPIGMDYTLGHYYLPSHAAVPGFSHGLGSSICPGGGRMVEIAWDAAQRVAKAPPPAVAAPKLAAGWRIRPGGAIP